MTGPLIQDAEALKHAATDPARGVGYNEGVEDVIALIREREAQGYKSYDLLTRREKAIFQHAYDRGCMDGAPGVNEDLKAWLVTEKDRYEQLLMHHRGDHWADAFNTLQVKMIDKIIDALISHASPPSSQYVNDDALLGLQNQTRQMIIDAGVRPINATIVANLVRQLFTPHLRAKW